MARSVDDALFRIRTEAETRGLKEMEKDLDDLASALDEMAKDTSDSGEAAEKAESKFTAFANNALAAMSGFLAAGVIQGITSEITGMVSQTLDWNDAFNRLNATTDITDEEFASLRDTSLDIFSKGFGEDMNQVVDNLSNAQRVTGLWGDELQDLTTGAMTIDDLFGAGFNETVRAANQTMLNFGADSQQAMDLLAYTFQTAGDPAQDLLDTINEYSSIYAQSGYSIEQMYASLIQGSEAGIFAFDKSADAIREFSIRFKEGTPEQEAYWNSLIQGSDDFIKQYTANGAVMFRNFDELQAAVNSGQISIAQAGNMMQDALMDIEDPLERAKIATSLIGTQFEDLGEGVLAAFDLDQPLGDATGAMSEMQDQAKMGLKPALTELSRTIQVELFQAIEPLVAAIVLGLIPAFQDLMKFAKGDGAKALGEIADILESIGKKILPPLTKVVQSLFKAFKDNEDTILTFAEYLAKAAAIVALVIGVVSGLSAIVGAAGAAFAILTSPIAIIIGLLVAFQYAYEHNLGGFADTVDKAVAGAKEGFDTLIGFFKGLVDAFQSGGISGAGEFIKTQVIDPLVNSIKEYVGGGQLWEDAKSLGNSIWEAVKAGAQAYADIAMFLWTNVISPLIQQAVTYVGSGALWENMKAIGNTLWDALKSAASTYAGVATFIFTNILSPLIQQIVTYVGSGALWDNLQSLGASIWEALKTAVSQAPALANFIFNNIISPLIDQVSGIDLGGLLASMASIGSSMIEALAGAISAGMGIIEAAVKGAINAAIPDHVGFSIPSVDLGGGVKFGGQSVGIDIPNPFPGYMGGTPWTGFGALSGIAGMVHNQEAVVPASGMEVIPSPRGLMLQGGMGQPIVLDVTLLLDGSVLLNKLIEIEGYRAP